MMKRPSLPLLAFAIFLGFLALAVHLSLMRQFEARGAFARRDLLFDADPSTRINAFSRGWHLGIKHPNLMPYFTPAVGLAAKVVVSVSPRSGAESEVRRALALLIVPFA